MKKQVIQEWVINGFRKYANHKIQIPLRNSKKFVKHTKLNFLNHITKMLELKQDMMKTGYKKFGKRIDNKYKGEQFK